MILRLNVFFQERINEFLFRITKDMRIIKSNQFEIGVISYGFFYLINSCQRTMPVIF